MKLLLKNTIKKINNSLGRFLSILFIIALGISIFMGLRESTAGMLYTADNYYDKYNLMDFKIVSTHGLTKDDLSFFKKIDTLDKTVGSYSTDVIYDGNSIRVHAIEEEVNNLELVRGRYPKNNNECLADFYKFRLFEDVSFIKEKDSILNINKCRVVGLVKSVLYIREDKGISTVGNGKLYSYIFTNKENFKSDYFTEIYLVGTKTKEKNSYYVNYEEELEKLEDLLNAIKPVRETKRYEEILYDARVIIEKENDKINDKLHIEELKLISEYKKLEQAKVDLDKEKKLNEKKFKDIKLEIDTNESKINETLSSLGMNRSDIKPSIKQLKVSINELETQLSELDCNNVDCTSLNESLQQLKINEQQLILLDNSFIQIDSAKIEYENGIKLYKEEIKKGETKINEGLLLYNDGVKKINDAKIEARHSINKEKDKLKDLDKPKWYVLDRTNNSGYIGFKEDVIKVEAISKILPIFFILISMLMILNTLTRLIEEERTEMGILLSNGFSKLSIISSYFIYVLLSGMFGIILGLTIGYSIVPKVIYSTFLNRYYVPKLITIVSPIPFTLVIITTLILMLVVTTIATYKELKEVPASLLRPKPPKTGKKIFIERISIIWDYLNFMSKTTIRNIFRYKKRIVMTTLGIAGTTALLIAGLGIKDSINEVSNIQYSKIIKYDSMYVLNKDIEDIPTNINKLFDDNNVVNPILINQKAYKYKFDNKEEDVYVISPKDEIYFNNYVNLHSTITDKKITIPKYGAIITKQLSEQLKVKVDDTIQIRNTDNELFVIKVKDIVENYVSHFIYISNDYYEDIFNEEIKFNTILSNGFIDPKTNIVDYDILTTQLTKDTISTFNKFVEGINKIIIMIVVFAVSLAFVVLYNLTIINVSERRREIATFKVLGFFDKEINSFIYKETLILTILGILAGFFVGKYLHLYIITTAQTDDIIFIKDINLYVFIIAAVTTILFSLIVQKLINKTINDINMIDSLKSVE